MRTIQCLARGRGRLKQFKRLVSQHYRLTGSLEGLEEPHYVGEWTVVFLEGAATVLAPRLCRLGWGASRHF